MPLPEALRIVVVDHAKAARLALRSLLESFQDASVVGEAPAGPQALELIDRLRPQLAFLSVRLPGIDGLELAKRIPRRRRPQLVFVSDRQARALEAFDIGAIDYLLKPVTAVRLRETLDRASERLMLTPPVAMRPDRLPVRVGPDILLLPLDQIASIVAEGDLLHVTTARNEHHTLSSQRLKDLEVRLDSGGFLRLSRSALANLRLITRLTPLAGGNYVATLANRQELIVSRSQARALRERLLRG